MRATSQLIARLRPCWWPVARVTGRAILAALRPLRGLAATLCDDDPAMLRRGTPSVGSPTVEHRRAAARRIAEYALVVTSPGLQPTRAGAGRRGGGGRPGLGRRRVGLAARPSRPLRAAAPLAGGHRHQRQDHDDVDAARDAHGRGSPQRCCAATSATRCWTPCATQPADLLAVELSSFQLHWAPSVRPEAGVVLNIAEDHLDWHRRHGRLHRGQGPGAQWPGGGGRAGRRRGRRAAGGRRGAGAASASGSANPPPESSGVRDGKLVDRAFAG